ncbi:hypothetical protein K3G63_21440 [Hymenobacter sp. HSC-4F20]|uniref:DUF6896 domain-containing protein n=1 Tax=Hymenobacter sp. HSC-4F20 TaxID=2864135 RepID=UPI001C73636D|nr:hypothetical protein [Hymenobacter sp. HSC-4F20]MBX0293022.1 hypothetical protein [Hymenobacter sp. HSC-4F20]
MLLHGTLSLAVAPPSRWLAQNQVAENDFLCFWSAALPYIFGAHVTSVSGGPLRVGETKGAVLAIPAEAAAPLRAGASIAIGTALREQIGHFVVEVLQEEPAQDLPGVRPVMAAERGALTHSEQQLFACIEQWVQQADRLCCALRQAYGLDFTRIGWVERNACMGQRGRVNGIAYSFHGIGCYFENEGLKLDVDFDSKGDWHGFDLWRIQSFIEWNYPQLVSSLEPIEQGLTALLGKKWLYQVDRRYDHDFYFVTPTT